MNIHDLQAFIAVVEAGSIVGASTRLNITQPGVSRRIQVLEESLGVPLLDRQSKPLRPTYEGLQAYDHGRRILGVLDELRNVLSPDDGIGGEFRVGITPYLSEWVLNQSLDALRASFPTLTLSVVMGWPEQLLEKLAKGELEAAAFCLPVGMTPPQDLESHALGEKSLVVVGAASLSQPQMNLRTLSGYHWVMNQDGCAIRSIIRNRFERAGLSLKVSMEILQPELRLSLVARGHGLSLATEQAIAESSVKEKLCILQVDDFSPAIALWLSHRAIPQRLAKPLHVLQEALMYENTRGEPLALA